MAECEYETQAQLTNSVGVMMPLLGSPRCAVFFKGLPREGANEAAYLYGIVLFAAGSMMTWAGPAGKQPMYAPFPLLSLSPTNRCATCHTPLPIEI
jgi:hypothetical protein